jgi:hypothetical protein
MHHELMKKKKSAKIEINRKNKNNYRRVRVCARVHTAHNRDFKLLHD